MNKGNGYTVSLFDSFVTSPENRRKLLNLEEKIALSVCEGLIITLCHFHLLWNKYVSLFFPPRLTTNPVPSLSSANILTGQSKEIRGVNNDRAASKNCLWSIICWFVLSQSEKSEHCEKCWDSAFFCPEQLNHLHITIKKRLIIATSNIMKK